MIIYKQHSYEAQINLKTVYIIKFHAEQQIEGGLI